jgi:hypothetical protein
MDWYTISPGVFCALNGGHREELLTKIEPCCYKNAEYHVRADVLEICIASSSNYCAYAVTSAQASLDSIVPRAMYLAEPHRWQRQPLI